MNEETQKALLEAAGRYIRKLFSPVEERIKALEAGVVEKADLFSGLERRFSDLSLSWDRQVRDMTERALEKMPKPEPGKDGRDFSQPEFEFDGRRTLIVRSLVNGEPLEETFRIPVVVDAGFWGEGKSFEQGDGVTHAGSYWIAQKDNSSKPEIGNGDWRLAVKKGRDAKAREVPL